jgi:dTDP-4-dehydrorhamnose reductase
VKLCLLGANGQLGQDLCAAFAEAGDQVAALTHQDLEIASPESVQQALERARADVVINCAVAHVELSENDPTRAFAVNAIGARNVARTTAALGATLVHISTDYVFDGAKRAPYVETDLPLPVNVYGDSKLAGEYLVRTSNPKHFVLRTAGIYGHHPCRGKAGLNFPEMMLKLARERGEVRVVDDEWTTPTPTIEVAQQIVTLLKRNAEFGLYHATSEGACTWYEFAKATFEITGTNVKLERARPGEFAVKVARPKYSVLENAALKRQGLNVFSDWRTGLERYLATRKQPALSSQRSASQR